MQGALEDAAVEEYTNTPRDNAESMFDYMYAELPEAMEEQRDTAVAYFGKGGH